MDFKKSFQQLKRPVVLLHYLLGTLGIWAVFKYLLKVTFIDNGIGALVVFYITYVLVDRISHGILEKV